MLYEMRIVSYTEAAAAAADADFLEKLNNIFIFRAIFFISWAMMRHGFGPPFFFTLAVFFVFFCKLGRKWKIACSQTSAKTAKPTVTRFCSIDEHMILQGPDKIRAVLLNIGRLAAL